MILSLLFDNKERIILIRSELCNRETEKKKRIKGNTNCASIMSTYNPETGYKIKVGGPTYKRLIREGKIKEARLPSKTSPKRKPGKKSPVKQLDDLQDLRSRRDQDLYLLREEYLNERLTPNQIETRLKEEWPDYLYQGRPIMELYEKVKKEIEYNTHNYDSSIILLRMQYPNGPWTAIKDAATESVKILLRKQYPNRSVAEIEDAAAVVSYFAGSGPSIDFLWLYNLKSDQFSYYPLNDHWRMIANKKRTDNPALIELYAK